MYFEYTCFEPVISIFARDSRVACFSCPTGHASAETFSLQVNDTCATHSELQEVQNAIDRLEQRDREMHARFAVVLKQLAEVRTESHRMRNRLRWALAGVCVTGCCCAALAFTIWRRG